ncbi:hypothetical protein N7474_009367 [Penicillium riverlandense]|uniref:uncharacterized protein n=1 Tax=Penicillium riverlandense TaxID=1903569 RepID=UPI0025468477|nr:uncharacterized protein N7474_009367 [Penicillium riverlandense]KAJ5808098.1 hypothetical protein N7474_009367 [Penicillium riverlandense]
MSDKREPSMSPPPFKRARISYDDGSDKVDSGTPHERPRSHPIYGQKSAFPGLDDGRDELFYGPAEDGLEYLRMVRSEASSLPSLFVASVQKEDTLVAPESQSGSSALKSSQKPHAHQTPGFWEDEAYIAPADSNTDHHTSSQTEGIYPPAQASYYNLLHHRFLLLRSTLRCVPPPEIIAALDDTHPISLPRHAVPARKEWRRLLLTVDPQMAQLACMDLDSVLGVMGIMARLMSETVRGGSAERVRRIGAWAWGLLGKCREVGQLATEEVGAIRELGKRVVTILAKIREAEGAQDTGEDKDVDTSDLETEEGGGVLEEGAEVQDTTTEEVETATDVSAELEVAKARLQARLDGNLDSELAAGDSGVTGVEDVAKQVRIMLDMIITVVGEYFGQRDLLDSREVWAV